jgi:hypothetical protein
MTISAFPGACIVFGTRDGAAVGGAHVRTGLNHVVKYLLHQGCDALIVFRGRESMSSGWVSHDGESGLRRSDLLKLACILRTSKRRVSSSPYIDLDVAQRTVRGNFG